MAIRDWLFGRRSSAGAVPFVLPDGWTSESRRVVCATPEGDVEKDITYYGNPLGMEFVLIPAGEFMMGSPEDEAVHDGDEGSVHKVRISRPFFLGTTPVTQAAYEQVVGTNPSCFKGPNRPVEQVSWYGAQEFLRKLCTRENAATRTYRLPTEAEWEYACRAGTRTPYYGADLSMIAWYDRNSEGQTHEVRQKLPNAFGLYDMTGNVLEWCGDWFDRGYYARSAEADPQGPSAGDSRVLRGGSWFVDAWNCRSANRLDWPPRLTVDEYGFRVVASSPPQE